MRIAVFMEKVVVGGEDRCRVKENVTKLVEEF
ncbi:MAG: hypothetical protein AOA66_1141 [Candidatus Bathyarchaeota archaeon BA2]|nr:MAG: hypothetical protein AOA66_1141 [Candidatus Bathyarchaeota archaeon BA2]